MADLTINGATIGYDENNIQTALNNLNRKVILDAIQSMNSAMSRLYDAVNAGWVGNSAETFKANMQYDKDVVAQGLNDTYQVLENEMHQIVNELADVDANLVEKRGN